MIEKYFDQLQVREAWISRARTITESDIVMFASLSGDWYPLHTDKEFAAKSVFKQRIAHGMLLLSAATGLMNFGPGIIVAFYGMEKVRFVAPVFIGDTIHLDSEIIDVVERDEKTGIAVFKVDIINQNNQTVAALIMKVLLNKSGQ
jgi:3-hydroxybutyryl-CoA dehydratase